MLSSADAKAARERYQAELTSALGGVDAYTPESEMLGGKWKDIVWPASAEANPDPETGLPVERLTQVGQASVTLPESFVSRLDTERTCLGDV